MEKILLAGDSTVTEQPRLHPDDPALNYCGWGQMLGRFLKPGVPVLNFAVSGLTTETFRDEGQHQLLMAALAPGDTVMVQFGHNDQKRPHLQAHGGYKDNLLRFLAEIRQGGGQPVLLTPVARNSWRGVGGTYCDLLVPYAAATRAAGDEAMAPVLDLNAVSTHWIKALGLQKAKVYFYPGDYTHPNEYGGSVWARMVTELWTDTRQPGLETLERMTAPVESWPGCSPKETGHLVYGWLRPPPARDAFADYAADEVEMTVKAALEMARRAYGYFAVNGPEETVEENERAAAQSGYLPPDFPTATPEAPVRCEDFTTLMQAACAGRNTLPPEAAALRPEALPGEGLSRRRAAGYALALERAATGCGAAAQDNGARPMGS